MQIRRTVHVVQHLFSCYEYKSLGIGTSHLLICTRLCPELWHFRDCLMAWTGTIYKGVSIPNH